MLLVLMASAAIYGTDFPDDFRKGDVSKYMRCLRLETNEANEPFPEPYSDVSTIAKFNQRMTYCGAERSRALLSLNILIKQRHPDWMTKKVTNSAEFVLSGMEIAQITIERQPNDLSVHDWPRQEF